MYEDQICLMDDPVTVCYVMDLERWWVWVYLKNKLMRFSKEARMNVEGKRALGLFPVVLQILTALSGIQLAFADAQR